MGAILSNVNRMAIDHAIFNCKLYGPCFNKDLVLRSSDETKDYDDVYCKKYIYEKHIRDTKDKFSIEDYEVFQVIRK